MPAPHLHFTRDEFDRRLAALKREMAARNLDGMLIFRQESMYYLTGYDTFGYVYFQCLVVSADGRVVLLTRAPDRRQAAFTSIIDDVRVWVDSPDAAPEHGLRDILSELSLFGASLGVEWDAYGLTAALGVRLTAAMNGFARLEDASGLISALRLIKSDAEIAYVRKAAELADDAWNAACEIAAPGAFEGDILAAMHGAVFRGGGDDPANEFIIGSGTGPNNGALMCRYFTGRRHLADEDQLTLEFAGAYRHYHACLMRTIAVGEAPQRQRDLWAHATEALLACEAAIAPGGTVGDIFRAHADTLDRAGLSAYRLNACGYSLGTTFAPNWMDWPMIYAANPVVLKPGMVFFLHMIIFDDDSARAATLGRTSLVTATGAESLSKASLDLVVV